MKAGISTDRCLRWQAYVVMKDRVIVISSATGRAPRPQYREQQPIVS